MSKEDNYKRTRDYIRSLKMVPSIPYLGMSLCWLILLLFFQVTCSVPNEMFFQFLVEMFPGAVGIVGKGVILLASLGWNSLLMLSRIRTLVR